MVSCILLLGLAYASDPCEVLSELNKQLGFLLTSAEDDDSHERLEAIAQKVDSCRGGAADAAKVSDELIETIRLRISTDEESLSRDIQGALSSPAQSPRTSPALEACFHDIQAELILRRLSSMEIKEYEHAWKSPNKMIKLLQTRFELSRISQTSPAAVKVGEALESIDHFVRKNRDALYLARAQRMPSTQLTHPTNSKEWDLFIDIELGLISVLTDYGLKHPQMLVPAMLETSRYLLESMPSTKIGSRLLQKKDTLIAIIHQAQDAVAAKVGAPLKALDAEPPADMLTRISVEKKLFVTARHLQRWKQQAKLVISDFKIPNELRMRAHALLQSISGDNSIDRIRREIYDTGKDMEQRVSNALAYLDDEAPILSEDAIALLGSLAVWRAQLRMIKQQSPDEQVQLLGARFSATWQSVLDSIEARAWALESYGLMQPDIACIEDELIYAWLSFHLGESRTASVAEMRALQHMTVSLSKWSHDEEATADAEALLKKISELKTFMIMPSVVKYWISVLQVTEQSSAIAEPVRRRATTMKNLLSNRAAVASLKAKADSSSGAEAKIKSACDLLDSANHELNDYVEAVIGQVAVWRKDAALTELLRPLLEKLSWALVKQKEKAMSNGGDFVTYCSIIYPDSQALVDLHRACGV